MTTATVSVEKLAMELQREHSSVSWEDTAAANRAHCRRRALTALNALLDAQPGMPFERELTEDMLIAAPRGVKVRVESLILRQGKEYVKSQAHGLWHPVLEPANFAVAEWVSRHNTVALVEPLKFDISI